jgi:DNA ligase D
VVDSGQDASELVDQCGRGSLSAPQFRDEAAGSHRGAVGTFRRAELSGPRPDLRRVEGPPRAGRRVCEHVGGQDAKARERASAWTRGRRQRFPDLEPSAAPGHEERHSGQDTTIAGRYRAAVARNEDAVELEVDGHELRVTSPGKVLFPERGETKLDLLHYYLAVAEPIMRTMGGRAVLMERYPHGATGSSFFQKRVPDNAPPWLRTTIVSTPNGTTSRALVVDDLAHVAWAVNLGCLGFHVWPSLAEDPQHADELRIDLDPQPGVAFEEVRVAARDVKALLDELGVVAWPKTTGSRGIHVYVRLLPRWDSYQVRAAAVALARELARRHPDRITDAWWKEERGERVFVDFNQNAPHKTVFGAWCVRARPGAQVSTPFGWHQLDTIDADAMTIATVPPRVAADGDPWEQAPADPQSLEPLLALAERDAVNGLQDAPWPPVYPKMPGEPARVAPSRARKKTKKT